MSLDSAIRAVRPGGKVGDSGAPAGASELNIGYLFANNVGVNGGLAYVREYIPELLPDELGSDTLDGGRNAISENGPHRWVEHADRLTAGG